MDELTAWLTLARALACMRSDLRPCSIASSAAAARRGARPPRCARAAPDEADSTGYQRRNTE